jgi:N-acetylmuramoyl-L-alanine amidase
LTTPTLLRRGDRGEAVRDLQERLLSAGEPVVVDGTYGPSTEDAVRAFQHTRGLRVDGVCGTETWGALIECGFDLGDRLLYLRRPMLRGDDVVDLQRRLNALGFDAGREDGILGPETEEALRQFQRNAGIAPDGVGGPATLAALARLGTLAAGSVAAVRERDELRRTHHQVRDRRLFLVTDPGLAVLGGSIARSLREAGANVILDTTGDDHSILTAEANRFGADAFIALVAEAHDGVRCAYFSNQAFRSEGGHAFALRLTEELRATLDQVGEPVGRTYRLLRETRMAAVVCELLPPDDPQAAAALVPRLPALSRAIVMGIRRGIEEPISAGE